MNSFEDCKNSEIILRKILEAYPDLIFLISHEGHVLDFKGNEKSVPLQPQDFIGKKMSPLLPEKNNDNAMKAMRKAIETRQPQVIETFIPIGEEHHYFEVKFIYNDDQTVLAFFRNVTSSKLTELKLRESETRYRTFVENFQGIAFQGYQDFSASFFHGAVEDITGYTEEDFTSGKVNWDQLIHPEDLSNVYSKVEAFHESQSDRNRKEYRIITRRGDVKWILSYYEKFFDDVQEKEGARGIILDITDKKKAEQKLKESEEKYRRLFNNAPFGIALFTFEGEILDCNEAISTLTGYDKKELIGNLVNHFNFYASDQSARIQERKQLVRQDKFPVEREIKLLRRDGTPFWASTRITPINFGNARYIQAIIQDISGKKKVEQELLKLNKLKSDLLRRTSHELKTPLISIKGFTDLLLENHKEDLNEDALSIIDEIKQGCVRLEALIRDILDASELESESIKVKRSTEDLTFLINYCIQDLKGLLQSRNQIVDLDLHDHLITRFEKERIYDVVNNLLTNAIKYSAPKSKIEIKSEIKDDFIVISIKDHGVGFTEEEKKQLFTQFGKIERYGMGLDVEIDGTGLGLYISKQIIELHEGKIWVESKGRNKGSTVYFSLPIIKT